jgi:feruloyl-CoA synthase
MSNERRRRAAVTGSTEVTVTELGDGARILRSPVPLGAYARLLPEHLAHWAKLRPERAFLAERADGAWRTITYAQMLTAVRSVAQALLDRGLSSERGLLILSENGIDHAIFALAAQYAGVLYAPVSPPYSLRSQDFAQLRHVLATIEPALVYASDGRRFERALTQAVPPGVDIVVSSGMAHEWLAFEDFLATEPQADVDRAYEAVTGDTIGKILFTSGSSGLPKAVINPQRMLCCNPVQVRQVFPFMADDLVMLDWAPWHHTGAGNLIFGLVLSNGGTLYIDDGRPTPADGHKTIRNLRDVAPTIFFNVPLGYEQITAALERDRPLREFFFSRVKMFWYAAAAISRPVWDNFRRVAFETYGEEILMVSSLGATETGPAITFASTQSEEPGNVGGPVPGVELKLVPRGEKLEICARGPAITPGYYRRPDLTALAFDDDGFYRLGDAVRPADPHDYRKGLFFDGRLTEDFKLDTGTWVSAGPLRSHVLARLHPLVKDAIVCGHDRAYLSILMIPDLEPMREYVRATDDLSPAELTRQPKIVAFVRERLASLASESTGRSQAVRRAMFLAEPLSLDAGEMTDKGSLNPAIILRRRGALVDELYATAPPPHVIEPDALRV